MTLKSIDISLGNLPNAFILDDALYLSCTFLAKIEDSLNKSYFGTSPFLFGEPLSPEWGLIPSNLELRERYCYSEMPRNVDMPALVSFLKTLDPDIFNKSSESDNTFTVELPSCSAYFGDK